MTTHAEAMEALDDLLATMSAHGVKDAPEAAILRSYLEASGEPVAWLHTLDNTDGIPENKPWRELSFYPQHPLGGLGADYSSEYRITSEPLYLHPTQGEKS